MTPSVGRIVHYQSYGQEFTPQPRAAVITEVCADGYCQLCVLNPSGIFFNECAYSETPKPGCWSWPPRI